MRTVTLIGADAPLADTVQSRLGARDVRLVPREQEPDTLVVVSSAMVYGAWPNNPVPLTEDAPMRPNPGFDYATAKAETERLALEWRDGTPGARLAVLRPATVLGGE